MPNSVPGTLWVLENVAIIIYQIPVCLFMNLWGPQLVPKAQFSKNPKTLIKFLYKRDYQ